jgi:dihydrofolate synthase/folylpolyglutamate synthase
VHIRLLGAHQADNARTAVATLGQLPKVGISVDIGAIGAGIAGVEWPARNQLVTRDPIPVLVDGAHNDASARTLRKTIEQLFPERRGVILILGTVRGHDPSVVARELAPLKPRIVVTETRHPKSLTTIELSEVLSECNIVVTAIASDTREALEEARVLAVDGDLIIGSGSLFVAAEIIEIEHGIKPELYPDIKLPPRPSLTPSARNP